MSDNLGFVEIELAKDELLEAIRHDCVTFFTFYIQEDLTLDVPELHVEIWEELLELLAQVNRPDFLVGHLQKLFAVPRSHAKSTIVKLAVILFMRYSKFSFTLYCSGTSVMATNYLRDIVAWFKSPQEEELYGAPKLEKSNETQGLWILWIGIPGQKDQKRIILKALGADQQVRGTLIDNKRPQIVIFDDIEDLDTVATEEQQKKLDDWALGSALKASAMCSLRIFIGNMLKSTSLLARLSKNPDWNPTVFGAIVQDKKSGELRPLWPGLHTMESLKKDYQDHRKLGRGYVWEAEMMNLNQDTLHLLDLSNAIMIPTPNPEDITCGFIAVDPAFGQKEWNDETALTVHVRVKGYSIPFTIDSRKGRWTEAQMLDNLVELSYYWNLTTWIIETNAAQRLLFPIFKMLLLERMIQPEVFTMLPVSAGKEQKSSRISAYRKIISAGSYGLSESQMDLRIKLEEYSPESKTHDDLCDSGAYGPICWNEYGGVIEAKGASGIAGALMQAHESSGQFYGEHDVCTI